MIGSQILAAPVFEEDGSVEYYLPPGRWFSFWDGKEVQGGRWLREKYNFLELPLFVRRGTVLVLGQSEGEGGFGYDWLNSGGEVRLYGTEAGDSAMLVDMNGDDQGTLEVDSNGELKGFELLHGQWTITRLD
jgi:alpha-D-xyloside xylohydrolase